MTPTGKSVYLASPLRAGKSCLDCHSTPEAAPPEMIKLYGSNNGFGWKQDEVIGAQIVSVPAKLAEDMADRAFRQLMISLGVVGGVTLLVLNLVLVVTVVRPVRRFAIAADQISTGQMEVPELPVRGKDEISMLAAAFNRMHRSLAAAMRMLDEK
jgi:protein-histidine pros-kinase